jgi:hypothetical protein
VISGPLKPIADADGAPQSGNIRYIVISKSLKWQHNWQQVATEWQQGGKAESRKRKETLISRKEHEFAAKKEPVAQKAGIRTAQGGKGGGDFRMFPGEPR